MTLTADTTMRIPVQAMYKESTPGETSKGEGKADQRQEGSKQGCDLRQNSPGQLQPDAARSPGGKSQSEAFAFPTHWTLPSSPHTRGDRNSQAILAPCKCGEGSSRN